MHATTKPEDKELLTKLRKLISTNEKIKKAEAEFRLSCKVEERGIAKFRIELTWLHDFRSHVSKEMLQIKTLSSKEELAVLEEENASKRKKLEEVAALDGRTPEGARRWLQCNEKASSGSTVQRINFQTFNFNLTFF